MRKLLLSIVDALLNLFRRKVLTIPHPEEPQNMIATLETVSIELMREKWIYAWNVPDEHYLYWRLWPISLKVNLTYFEKPYPALTWPDRTEIDVQWANPGVLAHEMAHVSYYMLTEAQKDEFNIQYGNALATDKLVQLMVRSHSYAATSYKEAHAEVYRFLGDSMPIGLKEFYPRLF